MNRPVTAALADSHSSFAGFVEDLVQAAKRGEITDAHAKVLEAAERIVIARALELAGGNQAKAARWLGIARQTVREKSQRFGIGSGSDEAEV